MAFPCADRQYAHITDAATGTADTAGGLGAILTQKDEFDNYYVFSYASRQLKDHEKIIPLSYWSQLPQYGVWTSSTSTLKAQNSFYSQTTNLSRKWAISTQKR